MLTPEGIGRLAPPKAMTRGHPPAGAVPDGIVIGLEKVVLLPLSVTETESFPPLHEPVTL
jgi:hypothetical protein